MRSSDPRHRALARRRRRLALAVGCASLLGIGQNLPARAQGSAVSPEELFGTFQVEARALGLQATYEIEGLVPGGAAVMDLGLPETLARFSPGSGYGLASLAYPGGIVANMGSLVAQSGGPSEGIPPYPIKAEAFYPAGPVESDTSQPGGFVQKVVTDDQGVQVNAAFPAIDANPLVTVGSVASASRSAVEGKLAVSRSRVVLGDVKILGGVIAIESLVTDLVAVHDGVTGSTAGGTTASGVTFLGLRASLTGDGLVLDKGAAPTGPAAPLGAPLGDVAGPLGGALGPVQEQLLTALGQGTPQVNDILARAGIELRIVDPQDIPVDSGAATRITTGLSLKMSYKGREQQGMVDLVNAIPPDLKPNFGPIPNPVTFLAENHIYALALAPATVSSLATPPFPDLELPGPGLPLETPPFDVDVPADFASTVFTTTAAPLPAPPGTSTMGSPVDAEPASLVSGAVPAILVALALVATPLFGVGSTRLADGVLAASTSSVPCPLGLEKPPSPTRPS